MADERIVNAVKIVDPDTTSQEAAVDSGSNLQVILASNTGVDIGDVDVISVVPGVGATNLGKAEDAVHSTGDTGVMALAIRDDTPSAVVSDTSGDYEPLHVDANGALYAILNANSGVDIGDVDILSVVPGIGPTNLGKREDDPHVTLDTGVMALAIRDDTPSAAVSGLTGDYEPLHVDANGALYAILNANSGVDIGDVDVTSIIPGVGATDLGKAEDAVHGDGDTGVMILAVRRDTPTALAADADYIPLTTDVNGRLHVTDPNAGAGSPTGPTTDVATSVAVAAGTTVDLDSAEIVAAELLWGIDITGSVAFKGLIRMVENSVDNPNHAIIFGRAGEVVQWRNPHRDFFAHAGASGGVDVFQVEWTNMDTSQPADAYATFYYST